MKLNEAIALIRNDFISSINSPMTWTDLGCGSGLFTNALSNLLKKESKIFAVDHNLSAFKNVSGSDANIIETIEADFINNELPVSQLDGILMANSLHYVAAKIPFINKIKRLLRDEGCFLIVEYERDNANQWVPYPINFSLLRNLFQEAGYSSINKLHERSSIYDQSKIYSALIRK